MIRTELLVKAADPKMEGWTWLHNSRKWHYFKGKQSMCKRFMLIFDPREGYEVGNDASSDNCSKCQEKLLASRLPPKGKVDDE